MVARGFGVSSDSNVRMLGVFTMSSVQDVRVVILAGGEGKRLANLTTGTDGIAVPKQYCAWLGDESLLRATLRRAQDIVPLERVLVSVLERHRPYWQEQLRDIPDRQIMKQPANRGTGMGVLLPLLELYRQSPDATVVLLPSDQHLDDESVLSGSIRRAIEFAQQEPKRLMLLGMSPDHPETEYGWVVPEREREDGTLEVHSFEEKPAPTRARDIMAKGSLWSSLIVVGKLSAFLRLYDRAAHLLLHVFLRSYQRNPNPRNVTALYDDLPELDFSRDLLSSSPGMLRCLPVPPCGWSDLGSLARVSSCLRERIGKRARRLRHNRGLSLEELSRRTQVQKSVLEKYEQGLLSIDPTLTREIAGAMNVSVEELLGVRLLFRSRLPSLSRGLWDAARISLSLENVLPIRQCVPLTEAFPGPV